MDGYLLCLLLQAIHVPFVPNFQYHLKVLKKVRVVFWKSVHTSLRR